MADQGHFENWTNVEFCNLPNNEISNFVTSQGPRDLVSNVTTTSLLAVAWASSCYGIIDTFSVLATTGTADSLITAYFHAGHKYKTIQQFLRVVHGFLLSMRQLKRRLKRLGLRRRGPRTAEHFRNVCSLIRVRPPWSIVRYFLCYVVCVSYVGMFVFGGIVY